jgi:hypothetical protein
MDAIVRYEERNVALMRWSKNKNAGPALSTKADPSEGPREKKSSKAPL